MGRTFLDIDMARAADLLGMERRQADTIRDLQRGEFLALGPAISRRPVSVRIGGVRTTPRSSSPKLMPLPQVPSDSLRDMLFAARAEEEAPPPPPPPVPTVHELMRNISTPPAAPVPDAPALDDEAQEAVRAAVIAEIAAEDPRQPGPKLYQDFLVRCRMRGVAAPIPLDRFRTWLAMAQAGIEDGPDWHPALALAAALPEEMLAPFLGLAQAAREGAACPSDAAIAALYGTNSIGRARRMLGFIEDKGLIVVRTDVMGRRSISLPHLGWTTAPAPPDPSHPMPPGRAAAREMMRAEGR